MIDINFYMKIAGIKQKLMVGERPDSAHVLKAFESALSQKPVIYNFESTNACNMVCGFCPRTNLMTREIESMPPELFNLVADQIEAHSEADWKRWEDFATTRYKIGPDEMSENHFFLYIIPRVIVLHGYGEPLLDRNLPGYVKYLSAKGIPTYFSCNPANIDVNKTIEFFECGLDYIKYSIDSVDDSTHKEIRGNASNFTKAYEKILKILEIKERRKLKS
ncbi:MAG: radical SAM protein, partial [Nitrospina sp.]|nr:radical SAM protein [Nitrospina sp.]